MKCEKCGLDFPEKEIQTSHDIPRYIGGTDKQGRHNLCIKCHNIYERLVFSFVFKRVPKEIQIELRRKLFSWKCSYFKDKRGQDENDS